MPLAVSFTEFWDFERNNVFEMLWITIFAKAPAINSRAASSMLASESTKALFFPPSPQGKSFKFCPQTRAIFLPTAATPVESIFLTEDAQSWYLQIRRHLQAGRWGCWELQLEAWCCEMLYSSPGVTRGRILRISEWWCCKLRSPFCGADTENLQCIREGIGTWDYDGGWGVPRDDSKRNHIRFLFLRPETLEHRNPFFKRIH
jgi:hypothetical protein